MKTLGNRKIGVVGVGNMGASILEGVLAKRLTTPSRVWVYDKDVNKALSFARSHGVRLAPSIAALLKDTDTVLLAMKPQDFLGFAREHRSSFKRGQGVALVLRLCEQADGLIEGFRPGVAERLGVGPQACTARNPRLVYGPTHRYGTSAIGNCPKRPPAW